MTTRSTRNRDGAADTDGGNPAAYVPSDGEEDHEDDRHSQSGSGSEEEEEEEEEGDEQEINDDSDSSVGFRPNRTSANPTTRGRPRGRPRGSRGSRGGSTRARGGPRGRPRGSGRARGRPRGRAGTAARLRELQRRPLTGDDPSDEEGEGEDGGPRSSVRTVNGKEYTYTSDELVLDDDEKGDTKITSQGILLGGREYKAASFCSPYRPDPEKVYILSIDAARTCGYRDSLYFFRRNKELVKLTLAGVEKEHLIDVGRLPASLKTRSVTMIAARNCFKLQGAKMLKNARWVTDDYYEEKARLDCVAKGIEPGTLVGDLPDPALPLSDRALTANQDVSGAGTGGRIEKHMPFYTVGGPTTHFAGAGMVDPFVDAGQGNKKQMLIRNGLTPENWMLEYARGVVEKNRELAKERRDRLGKIKDGFYYEKDKDRDAAKGEGLDAGESTGLNGSAFPSRKGKEREAFNVSVNSPAGYAPSPLGGSAVVTPARGQSADVEMDGGEDGGAAAASKKRKRVGPPLGVYDPHTHIPHVRLVTQPTRATLTRISDLPSFTAFNTLDPNPISSDPAPDSSREAFAVREAIGGARVGSSSWGLASVVLGMDLVAETDLPPIDAAAMEVIVEAEEQERAAEEAEPVQV